MLQKTTEIFSRGSLQQQNHPIYFINEIDYL